LNRILIVEDEPRLASFLEKGLRSNGFVTTIAEDGAKASLMAPGGPALAGARSTSPRASSPCSRC
jgi:DNA-binding response OmpR family regulator